MAQIENDTFIVRRGRLRFGGPLNERDEYVIQVDLSSLSSVNLRDAAVILRDLDAAVLRAVHPLKAHEVSPRVDHGDGDDGPVWALPGGAGSRRGTS